MDELQTNKFRISSAIFKGAWFLLGLLFVISLIGSITMIVQTMSWIRLHGSSVLPVWFHPLTVLSEGILVLSSVGLLILAVVSVLRNYRDR